MQRFIFPIFLCAIFLILSATGSSAAGLTKSTTHFSYSDKGTVKTARIVRWSRKFTVVQPPAPLDPSIDPKLQRAATIAEERAGPRTKARCWQYVKEALVSAGAVDSYPATPYAYQAGEELARNYGFKKLPITNPYDAPLGAVLVYGGRGHVELRTKNGFVSDYHSNYRCFFPLIGVYAKDS